MVKNKARGDQKRKAEDAVAVLETIKECELEIRRDEESDKLLELIKKYPGSTQHELAVFMGMEEFEFRRAFRWLEHKGGNL